MIDNIPTGNAIVCDQCSGLLHVTSVRDRRLGMMGDNMRWKAVIGCPACRRSLSGTGPESGDAIAAAVSRWQDRLAAREPTE